MVAPLRGWLRSLQHLIDHGPRPEYRLPGPDGRRDFWLGVVVTGSVMPRLNAWITRLDGDRVVCEPTGIF